MTGLCFNSGRIKSGQDDRLRKSLVKRIHERLETFRTESAALMQVIDSPSLSNRERRALFLRWNEVSRNGDLLELLLAFIQRREHKLPSKSQELVS